MSERLTGEFEAYLREMAGRYREMGCCCIGYAGAPVFGFSCQGTERGGMDQETARFLASAGRHLLLVLDELAAVRGELRCRDAEAHQPDGTGAEAGERLRRCPFCGDTVGLWADANSCTRVDGVERFHVGCPSCGVGIWRWGQQEVVAAWNRRADACIGDISSQRHDGKGVEMEVTVHLGPVETALRTAMEALQVKLERLAWFELHVSQVDLLPVDPRYLPAGMYRLERRYQVDGVSTWVVTCGDDVLTREGQWVREPRPSARDAAFLALTHFASMAGALAAFEAWSAGKE